MTTPLIRGIGRWGLMGLLINLFIGAGIFGLPSRAFELTNAYSLFAFAGCGFLIALIITCFVEVGSRYPLTGGPYVYASKTFGPVIGYQVGWLMWLTRVTSFAAIANILLSYLAVFLPLVSSPGGRVATITIVVLVLSYVNYIGVHQTARLSSWLAVAKLVPLLLFVTIGAFFVEPQNFDFQNVPSNESFALAVMLLVFAFSGFEVATINAGEVRDPTRAFPFALFAAITFVVLLYIAIQVICIGVLPSMASSSRPLADVASHIVGPAGAAFIALGAVISTLGTLNATLLGGSRLPFVLARQGQAPRRLADIHPRYQTPHFGVIATAAAVWFATITYSFVEALTINSIIRLITYAAVCAALPRLRQLPEAAPAAVLVRGGPIIAVLSLALVAWLLTSVSSRELVQVSIAIALGFALNASFRWLGLSGRGVSGG